MDRASIATALGEQLPDSILGELFPNYPLADIRAVLRGQQKTAHPKTPPVQQRTLSAASVADYAPAYKLFTDGASRGNPGEAGAGRVLLDADGRELAVRSAYLGQCTNNVAEYKALLLGVQSALELGCSRLEIFLDSQLIVRQLQGQYKVKHVTLQPLFAEVKTLLSKLQHWTVAHVPREQNKRADALANRGIDERGY